MYTTTYSSSGIKEKKRKASSKEVQKEQNP